MRRTTLAAASVLVLATGCGAADMTRQASPFANAQGAKTLTLSVQSWVGAQSNVAVAQYLLEHKLGYRVDTVQVDEVPAWDALSQGRVDAILEDWGHPDQEKRYVQDKKTISGAGDLGVTGHIGWFVPTYLVKQHPDITDWRNLDKYASLEAFLDSIGSSTSPQSARHQVSDTCCPDLP
ncbi:glycine betaine ABC transporter substrate-binding protein, partial [Streptomyces sp. NPDC005921]